MPSDDAGGVQAGAFVLSLLFIFLRTRQNLHARIINGEPFGARRLATQA